MKSTALISAIADLKEELALEIVKNRLSVKEDPAELIIECEEALRRVGERYQTGEYYLSGLIMGGEIFREVTELVKPVMETQVCEKSKGVILLGTVEGDIHDLGKNVVKILLSCYKLEVYDLGVDIPAEEFLKKAKEIHPDIIGLSGIITQAFDSMRETIRCLHKGGIKSPIIIGGSQLGEEVCRFTGADYWVIDAAAGVNICRKLLAK